MVEADSGTAVLVTLHSHYRRIAVDVQLLLQIGRGSAGTDFPPPGQRLTPNEVAVRSRCFEQPCVAVDPQLDPVDIGIAGILADALHPVDDLSSQALTPQGLVDLGIQRYDERAVALDQPVAGDFALDSDI